MSEPTEILLAIGGMHCAGCAKSIQALLKNHPGVREVQVDFATREARVRFDGDATQPAQLVDVVREGGYQAELPLDFGADPLLESARREEEEARGYLRQAFFAALIGVVLMILAVPTMALHPHDADPVSAWFMAAMEAPLRVTMPFLFWVSHRWWDFFSVLLGLIALAGPGRVFVRGALVGLTHRRVDMNTLVSLGTVSAWVASAVGVFWPDGPLGHGKALYFEGVAWLIAFVLFGRSLEHRARGKASDAVRALIALRPDQARLILPGEDRLVPLKEVRPGDRVRVIPGDRVPVDGEVLGGSTEVDEALLTGEPLLVPKQKGDRVTAGTLNRTGSIEVVARALGSDSVVGRLARLVRRAASEKAPLERLADQISSWFVPVVLALAVACLVTWMVIDQGAIDRAIGHAVAVLVVACPCALGLAMPVAMVAGMGRGARLGILFKGGDGLAATAKVDLLFFDKTGTLTAGKPQVVSFWSHPDFSPAHIASWVISLESHSSHPLAQALVDWARAQKAKSVRAALKVQVLAGKGIAAEIDQESFRLGTTPWIEELPLADTTWQGETAPWKEDGQAISALARGNQVVALWGLKDTARPEAKIVVQTLKRMGLRLELLSGDQPKAVAQLATSLGIEAHHGSVSPEEKLQRIDQARQSGHKVAMVGDGLNDGPALARADVGIAMASAADLAMEAAGVTLMRPDLRLLPVAIDLAKRTQTIIRQNLFWAFGYNLFAIPFAAGIFQPWIGFSPGPALAGLAMAFSSVTVVFNSLRLLIWRPKIDPFTLESSPRG